MDCREFQDRHLAFIDNTLSEVELVSMQRHLVECVRCGQHDTAIRRGLLVFRNLPTIQPSSDFAERLNNRLRQAHSADVRAELYRGPGAGSFMLAAAGVVAVGFLAAGLLNWSEPQLPPTLPPVIASRPELPSPIVSQAYVASASAGVPVWPAAMLAEQAPVGLAGSEFQFVAWGR